MRDERGDLECVMGFTIRESPEIRKRVRQGGIILQKILGRENLIFHSWIRRKYWTEQETFEKESYRLHQREMGVRLRIRMCVEI